MKIVAIGHTRIRSQLADFYAVLGIPVDAQSRTGDWVESYT
jgi:hypothetical protein